MSNAIAIDGPSASGKSTVAKGVARELGYNYVDSGALYRGITWLALQKNIDTSDESLLLDMMKDVEMEFYVSNGAVKFRINDFELEDELRSDAVNEHVSDVATVSDIRKQVVAWLREMSESRDIVMEGRDIGTVVFPQSRYKFYIDASPEERARRRQAELTEAPEHSIENVSDSLQRRDRKDLSRAADPLRKTEDAITIDTTGYGIEEVIALVVGAVNSVE